MIASVGSVVVSIIIVCLLVMWVINRFIKAFQQATGKGRCRYCRARLKFMGVGKAGQAGISAGYAMVCSKCGREQPSTKAQKPSQA